MTESYGPLSAALLELQQRIPNDCPEDEVEHLLSETGLYMALGFIGGTGVDIRRKKGTRGVGIPDALLLNSDQSVQVVVEVKRPSEDVNDHLGQLLNYVRELRAPYGLLTNGRQFRLFRREGLEVRPVWAGTESAGTLAEHPELLDSLRKLTLDPLDFTKVQERIQASLAEGLPLRRADDLASTQFLDAFKLIPNSPFAALVLACHTLLIPLLETSEFVGGSFAFWKQVYARKLGAGDIPAQWKALSALDGVADMSQKDAEERLYRFSFALETAYTMTARLILAKAIQDHDRAGNIAGTAHLATLLETQLAASRNARTGKLAPEAYLKSIISLFNTYAQTLFTSIYATDIFDWWRDYAQADAATQDRFADVLAQLLLTLLRFDFRELEGDLLGELYQQYFDPETRKALGEFYTPPAVVEFMLDELEYTGQGNLRLLDPATGSGTFIISALRRYLKANASRPPADVLRGITEDYLLVAFDVNPFAIMMAQINFAALLVPLYGKVVQENPDFVLRRLPIVRTDSLRQENLEGEQQTQGQQQGLNFGADTITAQVILPIRVGKETGLPVSLTFPQVEAAKRAGMVGNEREWLRALQAVFAGVEKLSQAFDAGQPLPDLNGAIRDHLAQSMPMPGPLADYLTTPYAQDVWVLLERLKVQHGDGRFLKTLEDLMLGLILKHYLKYDYVVGNPPYVRIQHLPEFQRRYWEDKYQWAHGNFDIYVPFVERAFQANGDPQNGWLTLPDPARGITGGRLAYIIPNRFLNAGYAENLRRVLPERAHIRSLLNFGAATFRVDAAQPATKLFREAMVYPAILSAQVGKSKGKSAAFPVVRLRPFELPSSPLDALKAVTETYATIRAGKPADLPADWGDALNQNAAELNAPGHEGAGWLTLTPTERVVWDKLEAVGAQVDPELVKLLGKRGGDVPEGSTYRRLKNYTATRSGGFQGVATALDAVMVLKKVGEKNGGALLQLVPKGGGNPVWIERDALRPFLFGKDVERWHIDYQDWYVLFPYLNTSEGFRLMPSADYRDHSLRENRKAFAGYPKDGPNLETAYPQFWKYLKANEAKLRGRENGKYKRRKKDEWRWYDLARPQSLEHSAGLKIVIQLLSKGSAAAIDVGRGMFFQAGGEGGGVYGLALLEGRNTIAFLSLFNSDLANYYFKNVSKVYSGGYQSFSDAYIKNLPIPKFPDAVRQQLSDLARTLTELTGELRALEGQIQSFPESVSQQLRHQGKLPDLVPLSQVSQSSKLASELRLATIHNGDTDIMGRETLRFGNGQLSGLSSAHAELVRATFTAVPGGKLKAAVLLGLNVPERSGAIQIYLDTLAEWRTRIAALSLQIAMQETQLNDTVYHLYGLNASDRAVIENYLSRY